MEFVNTGWLQLASVAHGRETYTRGVREYRMVRQEVFFPHRSAHKLLSNTGTLDVHRSLNMCMHGSIMPQQKWQSHEVVVVATGTANCLADRVSSADTNRKAYGVNNSAGMLTASWKKHNLPNYKEERSQL